MDILKKLSQKEFDKHLLEVNRIWTGKEGISGNRAFNKGISMKDMDYIFIRDDGWSIATSIEHFSSCNALWPDKWVKIYLH